MQALPHEIAIGFFDGRWDGPDGFIPDPMTAFDDAEDALQFLRDLTGENFGPDAARWEAWFAACPEDLLTLYYEELPKVVQSLNHPHFSQRVEYANDRWKTTTTRRCPRCTALCPEYRKHCSACGLELGRTKMPQD